MVPDSVSIVIVSYNNWPDIVPAIRSALDQSHPPVEVIVVDNESADSSPEKIRDEFGETVRLIRQSNRGDGGAYNTGMRNATGEFVQFLDGDDFLAADKIEKQLETFRAEPSTDIVYGDVMRFEIVAGREVKTWSDWKCRQHDDMLAALLAPDGSGAGLLVQSALFRRKVLDRVGEWDERLYMVDVDYWLRAASAGCKFRYCPGAVCFYQKRHGQMSDNEAAMTRAMEAVWEKALGYVKRDPHRATLATRLARFRFVQAISASGVTTQQRLLHLASARTTKPDSIPAIAYAIAWTLIVSPGGSALARSSLLKPLRRALGSALGMV